MSPLPGGRRLRDLSDRAGPLGVHKGFCALRVLPTPLVTSRDTASRSPGCRVRFAAPLSSLAVGSCRCSPRDRGVDPGTGTQRGCPAAADPSHAPPRKPGRAPLSCHSVSWMRQSPASATSCVRRPGFLVRPLEGYFKAGEPPRPQLERKAEPQVLG